MITGKTTYVAGWQKEYYGKLASGADSEIAASQYVCVDEKPEVLERGQVDENGKLFLSGKGFQWLTPLSTISKQCSYALCRLLKIMI